MNLDTTIRILKSKSDYQKVKEENETDPWTGASAPTGSCISPAIYLTTAGAMYNCQSGAWVAK